MLKTHVNSVVVAKNLLKDAAQASVKRYQMEFWRKSGENASEMTLGFGALGHRDISADINFRCKAHLRHLSLRLAQYFGCGSWFSTFKSILYAENTPKTLEIDVCCQKQLWETVTRITKEKKNFKIFFSRIYL